MKNGEKTKGIVHYLQGHISSGQWPAGYRIPTQRELSKYFGVNRSTVVEALLDLQAHGLIESRGRQGSFVSIKGWDGVASKPKHWATTVSAGFYKSNQPMIQAINQLEFDPRYVRLGTGELSPNLHPRADMAAFMAQIGMSGDYLGYECPLGYLPLREILCQRLAKLGIQTSPNGILITSGALQALHLISIGLMGAGAAVYTEALSYIYSLNTLHSVGLDLKPVKMDRGGLDVEALKQQLRADSERERYLYSIPTFQNPSGKLMDSESRQQLMTLAIEERLPIIEDDAYRELWLDEEPPLPLKSLDKQGHVLYLGTLSKILAPGLRIGWIVGPEPAISRLGDLKMQLDYGASGPSAALANAWLRSEVYEDNAERIRTAMRQKRDLCLELLDKHMADLALWEKPKGGFYIWLQLNKEISAKRLFEAALEQNILLNSGDLYGQEETKALRLSYAYADEAQLRDKIEVLANIIRTF